MKFISKSSNLLIILRPGMSAQPLTGTPAVPNISVRFKDGIAEVEQPELVSMLLAHPGFNTDFISSENVAVDPYAGTRISQEPAHEVTELKFGTPVSHTIKGDAPKLSPELQKLVAAAAIDLAKAMLPSMVEDTLKKLVAKKEESGPRPMKRRRGRKVGTKMPIKTTAIDPATEKEPSPVEPEAIPEVPTPVVA